MEQQNPNPLPLEPAWLTKYKDHFLGHAAMRRYLDTMEKTKLLYSDVNWLNKYYGSDKNNWPRTPQHPETGAEIQRKAYSYAMNEFRWGKTNVCACCGTTSLDISSTAVECVRRSLLDYYGTNAFELRTVRRGLQGFWFSRGITKEQLELAIVEGKEQFTHSYTLPNGELVCWSENENTMGIVNVETEEADDEDDE